MLPILSSPSVHPMATEVSISLISWHQLWCVLKCWEQIVFTDYPSKSYSRSTVLLLLNLKPMHWLWTFSYGPDPKTTDIKGRECHKNSFHWLWVRLSFEDTCLPTWTKYSWGLCTSSLFQKFFISLLLACPVHSSSHLEWLVVCRSRLVFITASDMDGYQDCILIEGRIDQCCTIEVRANRIFYF